MDIPCPNNSNAPLPAVTIKDDIPTPSNPVHPCPNNSNAPLPDPVTIKDDPMLVHHGQSFAVCDLPVEERIKYLQHNQDPNHPLWTQTDFTCNCQEKARAKEAEIAQQALTIASLNTTSTQQASVIASLQSTSSKQAKTISDQAKTMSDQAKTMSDQAKTIGGMNTTVAQQQANIDTLTAHVTTLTNTLNDLMKKLNLA